MDNATLMSGTALARPAWDAIANGRVTPVTSGSPGDAMESDARKKTREASAALPSLEKIEEMRAAINASSRSRLQIERAEDAGRFIYRILDPATGETVRQWPPEKYVELVAYLRGREGGLVDKTV
jgi:flagellar protein FlaG